MNQKRPPSLEGAFDCMQSGYAPSAGVDVATETPARPKKMDGSRARGHCAVVACEVQQECWLQPGVWWNQDYVRCGSIRNTPSKVSPISGTREMRELDSLNPLCCIKCRSSSIEMPSVPIGSRRNTLPPAFKMRDQ